jgi:phosphoribosylamine--glycine ligase
MAAKGYPGTYQQGTVIEGLDVAAAEDGVEIFHAGTKSDGGKVVAAGGRVLNVTARGKTVQDAQARAYRAVGKIQWPGGFYRRDIGWRAVERENHPQPTS